jgi:hypothetical protein
LSPEALKYRLVSTQPSDTLATPIATNKNALSQIGSSPIIAIDGAPQTDAPPTRSALLSMYYWQKQECGGPGAYIRKSPTSVDQAYLLDEPRDHKKLHLVKHAETMMATPIDGSHWLNTQSQPFNPLPSLPR